MRRGLSFVHPSFHSHSDTTKTKPDSMVWISPNDDDNNNNDDEDALLLQHAHALRHSLSKPGLSQFRVVALLLVDFFVENEDDNHNHPLTTMVIPGANQESGSFWGGAICAERAALLQLRAWDLWQTKPLVTVPHTNTQTTHNNDDDDKTSASLDNNGPRQQPPNQRPSIRRIYIVSDAVTEALPPGLLCREYLYGHPATSPETVFVLQSSSSSTATDHTVWKITLQDLYPFPSIYMKWTTQQQVAFGTRHFKQQQQRQEQQPLPNPTLWSWMNEADLLAQLDTVVSIHSRWFQAVLEAAHQATRYDERDDVHPIRYGAAALVVRRNHHEQQQDDTTPATTNTTTGPLQIVSARQLKALEYGATQDAVSQLLPQLLPHPPPHEDDAMVRAVGPAEEHDDKASINSSTLTNRNNQNSPLLLVQVDQFGIPHAPFAAARSLLVEHGLGTTPCLVASLVEHQQQEQQFQDQEEPHSSSNRTTNHSSLTAHIVLAQDLAPYVPNFRA